MKYNIKILIIILLILMFIPIGLCEKNNNESIENIKIYYENNKSISIYDKDKIELMHIKLISTISDIDKFIEVFEITNFKKYKPDKKRDFLTKTKVKFGKKDIHKIEYYIYFDISDYKIIYNETNKTNKTKIKLNDKHIWKKYNPYDKEILKNEVQKIKIIYYKKPELGFFKIQTIPIFHNVECEELTWYLGNWNLRRPILINNTLGDNVTDYQLKSVNLSEYQINASSSRIINNNTGLNESFWNQSVNNEGNLEFVWCNFSNLLNNTWINDTYHIYYQSIPNVNSYSHGNNTFLLFMNKSTNAFYNSNNTISPLNNFIYESKVNVTGTDLWGLQYIDYQNQIAIHNHEISNTRKLQIWKDGSTTPASIPPDFNHNQDYYLKIVNTVTNVKGYVDNELIGSVSSNIPTQNLGLYQTTDNSNIMYYAFVRKYTTNEPELWSVGDIEYPPELINVTCNIKIITHLTDKNIQIVNMNGTIVNESMSNKCINLSYDSYIVYMSNNADITSLTTLLNFTNDIFIQFLLLSFGIVILILFYVFIQVVKYKGFKGLK